MRPTKKVKLGRKDETVNFSSKAASQTSHSYDSLICVGERNLRSNKLSNIHNGKRTRRKLSTSESYPCKNGSDNIATVSKTTNTKKSKENVETIKVCRRPRKTNVQSLFTQSNLTGAKRVSKRLTNLKTKNKMLEKMSLVLKTTPMHNEKYKNNHHEGNKHTVLNKKCPQIKLDPYVVLSKIKHNKVEILSEYETNTSQAECTSYSNNSHITENLQDNITTNCVKFGTVKELKENNDSDMEIEEDICEQSDIEGLNEDLVGSEKIVESDNEYESSSDTELIIVLQDGLNNDTMLSSSSTGLENNPSTSKAPDATWLDDNNVQEQHEVDVNDQAILISDTEPNSCKEHDDECSSSIAGSSTIISLVESECYSVTDMESNTEVIIKKNKECNEIEL